MNPAIQLKDVHMHFDKGTLLEKHILKGLNLELRPREFATLIGTNGAGKSTLMNLITGDLIPSSGGVLFSGRPVENLRTEQRAPHIARIFQDPRLGTFPQLSIEENMALAMQRGEKAGFGLALNATRRSLFREELSHLGIGLENRLKDKVSHLSGGQRQALCLIMATLKKADIFLLDEPTAALDPKMAELVLRATREIAEKQKLCTLMVTHSMKHALEYGTRTLLLHQGRIALDLQGDTRGQTRPQDLLQWFED